MKSGKGHYLFGFEESYGCLPEPMPATKDAIVAVMALCEAAAFYKTQGKTLWDVMLDMYQKYGYYKDSVKSITMSGITGLAKIQTVMDNFRKTHRRKSAGIKGIKRATTSGTRSSIFRQVLFHRRAFGSQCPYYDLGTAHGSASVRPAQSRKIKFYYGVKGSSLPIRCGRKAKVMDGSLGELVKANGGD